MTKPKLPHLKKKPGRKSRYGGKTKAMRVPVVLEKEVQKFIREKMKNYNG